MGASIDRKFMSNSKLLGDNLLSVTTPAFLEGVRKLRKAGVLTVCPDCGMRLGQEDIRGPCR